MEHKASQPVVLVIGGPNGAGKSTCAEGILGDSLKVFHFVNADTIARGLSAYEPQTVAMHAGRLMVERLHQLGRERTDFAFETTLSGRTHAKFLADLKRLGYRIELLYISLPRPELCIERVAKRVAQGGHAVPPADILRRYHRSFRNLFNLYMPLADSWQMYDNSLPDPHLIAYNNRSAEIIVEDKASYDNLKKYARLD